MSSTPVRAAASRLAGVVARSRASRGLIPWFVNHYGVDLADAEAPAGGFASLQACFTRRLRPGARPIAAGAALVAPVDGTVGACGAIGGDTVLQAKGRGYSLSRLLGEEGAAFHGGVYCTIYLAPGDYHRVHAPAAAQVTRQRRIPGSFFSVNPRGVARVEGLFARNEREVLFLQAEAGALAMVLVGACLVGSIRLEREAPYTVAAGGEIGHFEFGSTVIVLAQAPMALQVAAGARVRMGEALARQG